MIQLALSDPAYLWDLRSQLERNSMSGVACVEAPDLMSANVLVIDPEHLRRIPRPISHPERIVLIAGNRFEDMDDAWNAGLQSVVLRDDPIGTAVLAVLAAGLQATACA